MIFLEFNKDLEFRLAKIHDIELVELHYLPYCFGHGLVAYKIKGYNLRFAFDGRDNELTIAKSIKHQKYPNATWNTVLVQTGLDIDKITLQNIIEGLVP